MTVVMRAREHVFFSRRLIRHVKLESSWCKEESAGEARQLGASRLPGIIANMSDVTGHRQSRLRMDSDGRSRTAELTQCELRSLDAFTLPLDGPLCCLSHDAWIGSAVRILDGLMRRDGGTLAMSPPVQ